MGIRLARSCGTLARKRRRSPHRGGTRRLPLAPTHRLKTPLNRALEPSGESFLRRGRGFETDRLPLLGERLVRAVVDALVEEPAGRGLAVAAGAGQAGSSSRHDAQIVL
jgi:hypothetical protein